MHSEHCEHPSARSIRVLEASKCSKHPTTRSIRALAASECSRSLVRRREWPSLRYFDVTRRFSCIFAAAFFFMI